MAAAGTVAWELVRGALNPFANIGSTNISQEQEVKRANCSEGIGWGIRVQSISGCCNERARLCLDYEHANLNVL